MPFYEHVFIVRQQATTNQVEGLTEEFSDIVKKNGGKVTKVENWGLRSLAYRIQNNKKGHYVLLNLDAPPAALQELERNQRINEEVIRFLSVKVEELEAGPSAILRKEERDFRDDDMMGMREERRPARRPRKTEEQE